MASITESDIDFYTLPNGIRVLHVFNDSPVAYCGVGVQAGTRNELETESGMAHFIEHTMFKGTAHRKAWHINAYTEKEETFIYATVLEPYFERAMELCVSLVTQPVFPQKEIDKEKEVIIDEINSYNDSPAELIYDDFEALVFNGGGLGRSVLGEADALVGYTTHQALEFHRRCYGTDKMLFFSMGKTPRKTLRRLVDKYLGSVPERRSQATQGAPFCYTPQQIVRNKDLHQVNYMTGGLAYSLHNDKRVTLTLLNNILGGPGQNSRLNVSIREKGGMSYTVESSYTAYTDAGIVFVYFSTDPRHRDRCVALLNGELRRLRNEPLTTSQLHRAKMQLEGQMGISEESKEAVIIGMAKSFLYYNSFSPIEQRIARIEGITAAQLMDVANEVFAPDVLSSLVYI